MLRPASSPLPMSSMDAWRLEVRDVESLLNCSREAWPSTMKATVCGSFNRHLEDVGHDLDAFKELGVEVLSPRSSAVASIRNGFLYVEGDQHRSIRTTEDRHLEAMAHSDFVWLVAPDGYLGPSVLFELGYAIALGIPVYSRVLLDTDKLLQHSVYVKQVASPQAACLDIRNGLRRRSMVPSLLLDPEASLAEAEALIQEMRRTLRRPGEAFLGRHQRRLYLLWDRVRAIFQHPSASLTRIESRR